MDAIEAAAAELDLARNTLEPHLRVDSLTKAEIDMMARRTVIAFLRAYVPSEKANTYALTGDPRDVLEVIADELEADNGR